MKKVLIALIITFFGLTLSEGYAFSETTAKDPVEQLGTYSAIQNQQQMIDDAYYNRLKRILRRGTGTDPRYRNVWARREQLAEKEKAHNVQKSASTGAKRYGELSGGYEGLYSNPSYHRTNWKQVFRRRAICYYVEDGACTSREELEAGVVYASTHKVPSRTFVFWKQDVEAVADARSLVRNLYTPPKVGAKAPGVRAQSKLKGGFSLEGSYYRNAYEKGWLKLPKELADLIEE